MPYSFTEGPLAVTFPTAGPANDDSEMPDALVFASGVYIGYNGVVTSEINFSPVLPLLVEVFGPEVILTAMREFASVLTRKADEIEDGTSEVSARVAAFIAEQTEH